MGEMKAIEVKLDLSDDAARELEENIRAQIYSIIYKAHNVGMSGHDVTSEMINTMSCAEAGDIIMMIRRMIRGVYYP